MNWIKLENANQLDEIKKLSFEKPQIIFKHSTTCGISSVSLKRFEMAENIPEADFYLLNLKKYRSISDAVATEFSVPHESPQVLVIKDGKSVYNESHFGIDMQEIVDIL